MGINWQLLTYLAALKALLVTKFRVRLWNNSSYIVGGFSAYLWKCAQNQTQLYLLFHLMEIILWFLLGGIKSSEQIWYQSIFTYDGNYFMEIYIVFIWWKRMHFPLRDFIQQEVLNHRDFPEEMSHQISIVFWIIRLSCDIRWTCI